MQLKLSVGDEMLTIDVKATDTFQDISDRLCSLGNIKVDMNQLRSSKNDKPFDMTTNVIEYFTKAVKDASPSEHYQTAPTSSKPGGLCRLCGQVITTSSHFLFDVTQDNTTLAEKVNEALPIHVSKKDSHPKQACDNCVGHLEESYDFVRTVIEAQNILEARVKPCETLHHTHKNDRCLLCNNGFMMQVNMKQEPKSSKKGWSDKSVNVQLPKPTGSTKSSARRARMDDENQSTEYYQSDEVVTGYWEPRKMSTSSGDDSYSTVLNSYSSYGGSGRKYRKRMRNEDDQDWTIDEEYIPVSRRGRPKGTKNKPKVVSIIKKSCILCDWTGADLDMLAHTINIHCQPDLGYFPCPMCKTRHDNEMELESHIEEHTMAARKMK